MNILDVCIIFCGGAAIVGGYRLGFLARATSWIGLGLGVVLALRFLPALVTAVDIPDPATRLLLVTVVLVVCAFAGQALGLVAGTRMRDVLPPGPPQKVDHGIGAFVGLLGVLLFVWLVLPWMADVPGWPSQQVRHSAIATFVHDSTPTPPTVETLRRLVGDRQFPRVFDTLQPAPDTGAPPVDSGLAPDVEARVTLSTVKVEGVACERVQEGSGFVAAPETVVTNAHVVAGVRNAEVFRSDGLKLSATVTVFDSNRDLAVLRVPGLDRAALIVGEAEQGERGAVFGHPGGQAEIRVAPAAIRQQVTARGRDLYESQDTKRDIFILAANLQPGDSGGALVDTTGEVVGVAFAIAPDRSGTAYALTTKELNAVMAQAGARARTDTGDCIDA